MEVPVDSVMAGILDNPVPAIGGEHALWIGLFGRLAGDAQRVFDGNITLYSSVGARQFLCLPCKHNKLKQPKFTPIWWVSKKS